MPDRVYGGLRERGHGSVDDGLTLNALIVERVLYGGHKCRQRRHVRGQRIATSSLDVREGMARIAVELHEVRYIEHR